MWKGVMRAMWLSERYVERVMRLCSSLRICGKGYEGYVVL